MKVSQNVRTPKARYVSVCYTAPKTGWKEDCLCCKAHFKAIGDTRDNMTVVSFDPNHTCGTSDTRRKRNYLTRDIAEVSDVLGLYELTSTKHGNTRQFIRMTKASTGVTLKAGQAALAIRSRSHDTVEAHIGQYMWIPSVFETYKESDPAGTYIYESSPCAWDNGNALKQFKRCYACISIAKMFWENAGISLFLCDGTHTKCSSFKHILLLAVTFDGNNQLVLLAFAVVDVENSDNWV